MFSRILGIIVCLCIIALGVLFISSSSTSNMAPMISGTAMIFITMIVLTAICISIAEDIVGIVTHQHEGAAHDFDPFQDDFTFHRDLNTPDPHLIHPDDINGQRRPAPAVYGSRFEKQQADHARLNIKV